MIPSLSADGKNYFIHKFVALASEIRCTETNLGQFCECIKDV